MRKKSQKIMQFLEPVTMALHQGALAIFENNVGVSDCVLLDPVTEDAFIENIKQRFNHDQIYVSGLLYVVLFCLFLN